jgi:hypothetical protein
MLEALQIFFILVHVLQQTTLSTVSSENFFPLFLSKLIPVFKKTLLGVMKYFNLWWVS